MHFVDGSNSASSAVAAMVLLKLSSSSCIRLLRRRNAYRRNVSDGVAAPPYSSDADDGDSIAGGISLTTVEALLFRRLSAKEITMTWGNIRVERPNHPR